MLEMPQSTVSRKSEALRTRMGERRPMTLGAQRDRRIDLLRQDAFKTLDGRRGKVVGIAIKDHIAAFSGAKAPRAKACEHINGQHMFVLASRQVFEFEDFGG